MKPGALARVRAVAVRELRDLGRSRTPFVLRTVFAAMIGALVTLAMSGGAFGATRGELEPEMLASMTAGVFKAVIYFECFLVLLMGAMLGVISATSERSNKTLGLIVLSRLRAWEVVAGKLFALLGLMTMVVLAALPLFALLGWGGGVDYPWLARSGALMLVASFFSVATGLAMGWTMSTFSFAAVLAAVISLAAYLAPLFAGFTPFIAPATGQGGLWQRFLAEWLPIVWIGSAVEAVASQGITQSALYRPLTFNAGVGFVFLLLAVWRMRSASVDRQSSGLRGSFEKLDRGFDRINIGGIRIGGGRRRFGGNPVAALGRTMSGFGSLPYAVRIGLVMFIVSLVVVMGAIDDRNWVVPVLVMAMVMLPLLPMAYGAAAVAGERERKSLTVLLSTPLTGRRILRGKALTSIQLYAIVVGPALALVLTILPLHPDYPLVNVAWFATVFLAESMLAFCLGIAASLFRRSALRASLTAALLLFGANVLPMLAAGGSMAVFHSDSPVLIRSWVIGIVAVVALVSLALLRRMPAPAARMVLLFIVAAVGAGAAAGFPIDDKPLAAHIGDSLDNLGIEEQWAMLGGWVTYVVGLGVLMSAMAAHQFDRALSRSS